VVRLKRKVIQIAGSTQLISLPRTWSKKLGIKRGQELNVEEEGNVVVISADKGSVVEKADLDVSNLDGMTARYIYALYKEGIDEIKVSFNKSEQISEIQAIIGKDTVGYELLEQGEKHCIIRYVSGNLEEFDSILRRTFLLLLSMIEESATAIKNKQFERLKNIAFLEETNNRFTTICRRALNKNGHKNYKKIGPIYYIIEELEKIADQYKYTYHYLYKNGNKNIKTNKDVIDLFEKTNSLFRLFYEVFYRFDNNKIIEMKKKRDALVERSYELMEKAKNPMDNLLIYHSLTVTNQVFGMLSPYIVHVFSIHK
jgi:phosphate uptake regulator